ncbi:unnamed protein product [Paramecium octaurelia]|uniref:CTLH domain-containing protein n=1 Tax=Paramecium octaurelia TaxID=43137 RepID=A0A8S1W2G0_PAROT|nr:unnamed protein product [Paramecium octaurelia]
MPQTQQILQMVLVFLRDQKLFKSLLHLELETQISIDTYTRELQFLRQQILDGNFIGAEQYLQPLKTRLNDQFSFVLLELKKQQYFELINAKPDVEILITLLRQIEQLASPEVYKNLCYFLTLSCIRDHPEFSDWSVEKGRLDCFEGIASVLKNLGKTFRIEKYNGNTLQQLYEKVEEDEENNKHSKFYSKKKSQIQMQQSSSSQLPTDFDKNIIIEKLHISDINENDQSLIKKESVLNATPPHSNSSSIQSQLFNYKFDEMDQVATLSDTHPIRAAAFSSDGEMFAIGTNSKSLRIFSMKSVLQESQVVMQLEKQNHHQGSIYCIDWSRSGRLIGTGSNDKTVKLYNVEEDTDFVLVGHRGLVRSVCFSDENRLMSAGQDAVIKIWDVETQKCIRNLEGHTQTIYCLQTAGDGSYQVSCGMDRTLRIWDQRASRAQGVMTMQTEINYVSLSESTTNYNLQNLVKGSKKAPQFSSQGLAVLAHSDGVVSVWNIQQQKCVKTLKHHTMDCRCVEFDPTGRYICSVSFDSTIALYDWEQQKLITQITDHEDRVVLCKWHPFYPFILSTSADCTGRIFAPHGFLVQLMKSL